MGITKLMLICLIGAIIEVLQMVLIDKSYFLGKPDPDAVTVIAHKVHEPGFNYIPGRQTYDDKSGRYVTDWKYEWEYEGKNIRSCTAITQTANGNTTCRHFRKRSQ